MEKGINQEELNNLIAQEIRDKGLNEVLKLEAIRERVVQKLEELGQSQPTQTVNELENPAVASGPTQFPTEEEEESLPPAESNAEIQQPVVDKEAGDVSLNATFEPKVSTQDIPDFLKKVEPGKLIIFDYNELSEGGENLTNKPFKTFDNPEEKKSINQMWSEEGKTKAEVYQAKFEKIGDLIYDYKNGITNFEELNTQPETDINGVYKENPYKVEPNPIIEKDIEGYITQNVDMDQKVNDVITNIVKTYFLTNSEKAVNDTTIETPPEVPIETPVEEPVQYQNIAENFKLEDLVGLRTEFVKIDTPKEVENAFNGKSTGAKLVSENNEVKKFVLDGKDYFLPTNPISTRKCYIKEV